MRHLRYFTVVADELHFGRAAARLHMAQPPLSQRIQRLERELGVRLLDRSPRRVTLTTAGRELLRHTHEVLAAVDRLAARAAELAAGTAGRLRVGLLPELGASGIAAVVRAVERACPGIELDLSTASTADNLVALRDRAADVATVRLPADLRGLAIGPVLRQPLGVALPAGSPLAERDRLALADLAGLPLALFPRSAAPGLYDEVLDVCARNGYVPEAVHHPAGPAAGLALALAGTAATFVDAVTAAREPGTVWRPLAGEPLAARVAVVWPEPGGGPAAETVAAAIAEALCAELGMAAVAERPGPVVHVRPASGVLA